MLKIAHIVLDVCFLLFIYSASSSPTMYGLSSYWKEVYGLYYLYIVTRKLVCAVLLVVLLGLDGAKDSRCSIHGVYHC